MSSVEKVSVSKCFNVIVYLWHKIKSGFVDRCNLRLSTQNCRNWYPFLKETIKIARYVRKNSIII